MQVGFAIVIIKVIMIINVIAIIIIVNVGGSIIGSFGGSFIGSIIGSFGGSIIGSIIGSFGGSLIGSFIGGFGDSIWRLCHIMPPVTSQPTAMPPSGQPKKLING